MHHYSSRNTVETASRQAISRGKHGDPALLGHDGVSPSSYFMLSCQWASAEKLPPYQGRAVDVEHARTSRD